MNTREKIEKATNPDRLCLHREGIFYKLYNQHIMLFTKNIKELKVNVKFVKIVNQHVYSGGFPVTSIDDIKNQCTVLGGVIETHEKMVVISNVSWQSAPDYEQWCEQCKADSTLLTGEDATIDAPDFNSLKKQINGFAVMRKTPLDAMNFIMALQKQLNPREMDALNSMVPKMSANKRSDPLEWPNVY